MLHEDLHEPEESLIKINKVCKMINIIMKLVFALFCICWLLACAVMVYAAFCSGALSENLGIFQLCLYLAHGVIIASILGVLIGIFSDVAKGQTPFAMVQVKRLRIVAILLLFYALVDAVIAQNNTLLNIGVFDSGYVSVNESSITTINLAPIIVAAVVFAFSFVFKYGVLLQNFTDETL